MFAVYRKSTNEYWEIKPMSCNDIDKLTYSINLAGKQLSKYYNMHIYREKDNEHAICARPGEAISPGTFKYECYLVSYASYELGVIIYAYDIISSPIPQKAKEKEPSRSLLNRGPAVDYIYDYADEASARNDKPGLSIQ